MWSTRWTQKTKRWSSWRLVISRRLAICVLRLPQNSVSRSTNLSSRSRTVSSTLITMTTGTLRTFRDSPQSAASSLIHTTTWRFTLNICFQRTKRTSMSFSRCCRQVHQSFVSQFGPWFQSYLRTRAVLKVWRRLISLELVTVQFKLFKQHGHHFWTHRLSSSYFTVYRLCSKTSWTQICHSLTAMMRSSTTKRWTTMNYKSTTSSVCGSRNSSR